MIRIRDTLDDLTGSWIANILDRLYLGELLRERLPSRDAPYYAALQHLLTLPPWRLWIASKALGFRPIQDLPLTEETPPCTSRSSTPTTPPPSPASRRL